MKLLMFFVHEFWLRPQKKTISEAPEFNGIIEESQAAIIFYHAEPGDEQRSGNIISKFVKNVKWLAGKFQTKTVILHSFNHLGSEKASPEVAIAIVEEVKKKLENSGYRVLETPFGYQNEWKMHVAGDSLAKVFKEI
ncbi:MAG: threonyl-tRNA synthetase editing domain-containing protein [Syntrophobacterales bacterium]|nr:threonyl-tRNA synthetase editing domain-containing protein [Syntrophobacterales bacterium]